MDRRAFLATAAAAVAGCGSGPGAGGATTTVQPGLTDTDLSLTSPAFDGGGTIPAAFTCEGENVNPELSISEVPDGAGSLALVVDDPDAPGERPFVHWLLWNVPPDTATIPRAVPRTGTVGALGGARQGTNSAGDVGYAGPCPPTGDGPHTYRFRLHALESELSLRAGSERPALSDAMAGSLLARTTLRGTFARG